MSEVLAPIVPAEVDLRGLDYMPLFGNHLFGSEFNARASDAEWRAALTLWWAAWNQKPAGSLPADDVALCRLADLGRDIKAWNKVRNAALHGFVLCSDGRLYHEFLCRQVLIAWDKRVQERNRKALYRAKKAAEKTGQDADVPRDNPGTGQGRDADVPADGNRRDVTGRDGNTSPIGEERVSGESPVRTRKIPMPSDFGASAAVRTWAESAGYTHLDQHLEAFRNKAYAKGYRYADWDRAFMEAIRANWAGLPLGSSQSQQGGGHATRQQSNSAVDRVRRANADRFGDGRTFDGQAGRAD